MRKILFTTLSVFLLALASCSKGDGDLDYGLMKIYMPQAMANGGIGNVYNVPSGGGTDTYNFSEEADSYDVYLGVMRSGKEAGEAFSVSIVTDAAETAKQAEALGAAVMPQEVYTLPSTVKVDAGNNSAIFHLTLKKAALDAYAGSRLVLCVALADPSAYELSTNGTVTTVLVDVDALRSI